MVMCRLQCVVAVLALLSIASSKPCSKSPFGNAGDYALFATKNLEIENISILGGIAGESVSVLNSNTESYDTNSISSGGITNLIKGTAIGKVTGLSFQTENFYITENDITYDASTCCSDETCTACEIQNPISFEETQSDLNEISNFWENLPTNGKIINRWNTLILSCNDDDTNIFSNIDLTNISSLKIKCEKEQTVLINYSSQITTFGNIEIVNTEESTIIHHFNADSISISNMNINGFIFAPKSNIQISGINLTGLLIGKSILSKGSSISYEEFNGCIPIRVPKPNYVIFLADDLGYGDISSFGAPDIVTPNIDKLVYGGKRLSNFYVSPMCSPTRSALLTGRLPIRTGCYNNETAGFGQTPIPVFYPPSYGMLPASEILISNLLDQVGYNNGLFGKWHLGTINETALPLQRGFHKYWGMPYSTDMGCPPAVGYPCVPSAGPAEKWVPVPLYEDNTIIEQPTTFNDFTSRLTGEAMKFIEQSVNQDKPFYVNVNYLTVSKN